MHSGTVLRWLHQMRHEQCIRSGALYAARIGQRSTCMVVQQPAQPDRKPIRLRADIGGRSDAGRVRAVNQDCYCVLRELGLLIVSDGVGGHAHGEIASAMAVEAVTTHCLQPAAASASTAWRESLTGMSQKTSWLAQAVHWANRKIRSAAAKDAACHGMCTTLVAAWLEEDRMSVAHIGDSRLYLLRGGALKRLTRDHSLAAERVRRGMVNGNDRQSRSLEHVLLRALGTDERMDVDLHEVTLQDQDVILLCTDGLTHMVSDAEIAGLLARAETAQEAADQLVALANSHGGTDNITAVVARMSGSEPGLTERLRRLAGLGSSSTQPA
jgi:protein phosphatase